MSEESSKINDESNGNNHENKNDTSTTACGKKIAFTLGGGISTKKKKTSISSSKTLTKGLAADFGHEETIRENNNNNNNNNGNLSHQQKKQAPLIIPLSQPSNSLLLGRNNDNTSNNNSNAGNGNTSSSNGNAVKQEEESINLAKKETGTGVDAAVSSSAVADHDLGENTKKDFSRQPQQPQQTSPQDPPDVASSPSVMLMRQLHDQETNDNIFSKEQFQRDLEHLPDETNEESYEHIPVSQFGAALLRGMGWKEEDENSKNKDKKSNDGTGMPRPHRLGLGAIPKATINDDETNMPSVLTGKNKKKQKKLTVPQLQQQEEYERQREIQRKQDKQRTLQIGSIVYLQQQQPISTRAKVLQLQGVPGLNMVKVQIENENRPSNIKKGLLGELVHRRELAQTPFVVIPESRSKNTNDTEKVKDKDYNNNKKRKRNDHGQERDRSRSCDGESDKIDRNRDEKSSRRNDEAGRNIRDWEDKDRSSRKRRDDDERSGRKGKDKDRDRKRRRHHRDSSRSSTSDRSSDGSGSSNHNRHRREDSKGRRDEKQRKKSRSEKGDKNSNRKDSNENNPLWMIPNIRVRVVTEKLGKRHFKKKGIIVDVTRRHGATLRMDRADGGDSQNQVVLEHVPEPYLETALPKPGGQAIVLTGPNKWAKGRLLERDSKKCKGSIQVFEDMNIITLPLDDIAEWCGPLDDDLE